MNDAAYLGMLFGSIISMVVVSWLISFVTKRFFGGYQLIFVTITLAYLASFFLSAFGNADNAGPKWGYGWVSYGLAALIVGAVWALKARKRSDASNG